MRRPSARVWALVAIVVVVLAAAGAYLLNAYRSSTAAPTATHTAGPALADVTAGPYVAFRSTAPDDAYGSLALVPLDDPSGPRTYTDIQCDRVAAVRGEAACLRTNAGVATTYEALLLGADWSTTTSWPLPGVPSRTRLSPDGRMVATTAFVTGHSYATTGFVTQTLIHDLTNGTTWDLEEFSLIVDGEAVAPVDRNLWGVTFVDDTTFYATAQSASMGHTWLVRGDLDARTVTAIHEGACPSLSPDGTRLAFKVQTSDSPVHWSIGILDLATGEQRVLTGESRSFDDQIAWLDDDTVLYGLPRENEPGVTDVWALGTQDGSTPRLFIPEAWSPQVVGG